MKYISTPNLPISKVSDVIMNGKLFCEKLNVINTAVCKRLPVPEQLHADMQIIHLGKNLFICTECSYEHYTNLLRDAIIIKGQCMGSKYPENISLNACIIGNKLFCNKQYTDKQLLEKARNMGYDIISVNQGYTKCSTAIVSHNAVITSDSGLHKIYLENGLDCLLIQSGHIRLEGYNYGFIGGCCGKINYNEILFYGDITKHPNFNEIKCFCSKHGCNIKYIEDFELTDIGSILPICAQ